MDITALTHDERIALVALAKWVVHADERVSDEEKAQLAKLRGTLGAPEWNSVVRDARRRFTDPSTLATAAEIVERPQAREAIYAALVELARADAFDSDEVRILNWVAQAWGFVDQEQARAAEAQLDEAHEEPDAIDEYVMFEE